MTYRLLPVQIAACIKTKNYLNYELYLGLEKVQLDDLQHGGYDLKGDDYELVLCCYKYVIPNFI